MFRQFYIIAIACLLVFTVGCRSYKKGDPLERTVSLRKKIEDFQLFKEIIKQGHPSLNSYLSKKQERFLFDSIYATITEKTSTREFYNKLFFLTNKIGCSHTVITLPGYIFDTLYNRNFFFPEPLILIEGRLLANADYSLPHGTEILSINNTPVKSILADLAMYNPIDGKPRETQKTLAALDFGFQYYLNNGAAESFRVSIKDTLGKTRDTVLAAITLNRLYNRESDVYYYDAKDVPYSLHINEEDNYVMLRLTSFDFTSSNKRAAFEDFLKNSFELLRKKPECKNLIIDLRDNGGGYLFECFLLYSYLAEKPFKEYKSVFSKIDAVPFPDYLSESVDIDEVKETIRKRFGRSGPSKFLYADSLINEWEPDKNRFLGNVFIISNSKIMSAASYFSTLVKNSGRGKVIGVSTTGGEYSGNGFETLEYQLPNSQIQVAFPYANIIYTYGSPKSGNGLKPDHYVPDNKRSFMRNKDPQLLYIIDSLINKKK